MKDNDFAEASVYLRLMEKKMLNGASVDRVIDAANASDALRMLAQNSEYDFSSLKRTEDYELVLQGGLKGVYDLVYKLSGHREIADIPAAKYDFHNLKVALKSKYLGLSGEHLYSDISGAKAGDIEAYVQKGAGKEELPAHITAAADEAAALFAEKKDPQDIDVVLDRHMFAYMLLLCKKVKSEFISEYVQTSIEFYNIKTLLRVKNMRKGSRFLNQSFIQGGLTDTDFFLGHYDKSPDTLANILYYKYFDKFFGSLMKNGVECYAKTGNYSGLEKLFDDYLMAHIKKSKYIAFGPEVLFAYIISKENEIRQIRILVTGKSNYVKAETIRERLRDNYA